MVGTRDGLAREIRTCARKGARRKKKAGANMTKDPDCTECVLMCELKLRSMFAKNHALTCKRYFRAWTRQIDEFSDHLMNSALVA